MKRSSWLRVSAGRRIRSPGAGSCTAPRQEVLSGQESRHRDGGPVEPVRDPGHLYTEAPTAEARRGARSRKKGSMERPVRIRIRVTPSRGRRWGRPASKSSRKPPDRAHPVLGEGTIVVVGLRGDGPTRDEEDLVSGVGPAVPPSGLCLLPGGLHLVQGPGRLVRREGTDGPVQVVLGEPHGDHREGPDPLTQLQRSGWSGPGGGRRSTPDRGPPGCGPPARFRPGSGAGP
jgi:hypothetical protein